MYPTQAEDAALFAAEQAERIAQVRTRLLRQVRDFLYHPLIVSALPSDKRKLALLALSLDNLNAVFAYLRSAAATVCRTSPGRGTALYWDVIDALGFFQDATGVQYAAMPYSHRASSLGFVEEYLANLQAQIPVAPTDAEVV